MGALGRALGSFGSQVGEGYSIEQDWKRQASELAIAQARQKLAEIMGPLQLKLLQQKLDEANRPQAYGTVGTPGGGTAGVTFDPKTGKFGDQPLISGVEKTSQVTGDPIPGEAIGREKGTYWRSVVDQQGNLVNFVPAGPPKEVRPEIPAGNPIKGELIGKPKGTFWKSIVDGAGNTIGYAQTGAPTPPRVGSGAAQITPQQLDATVQAIAAGQQKLPGGSLGVKVVARAKEMGVTLPNLMTNSVLFSETKKLAAIQQMLPRAEALAQHPEVPQNSLALAALADKMEGGSGQKQALLQQGQPFTLFGIKFGTPGSPVLPPEQAQALLKLIQDNVNSELQTIDSLKSPQQQGGASPNGGAVQSLLPPGATSPGSLVKQ